MNNKKFNLLDKYMISVNNDKIRWTIAEDWFPGGRGGYTPMCAFTDYYHGEGIIVRGGNHFGDILVLKSDDQQTYDDCTSQDFYEELYSLPKWLETAYILTLQTWSPTFQYCENGDDISDTEAIIIMKKTEFIVKELGYEWAYSDEVKFENEKEPETIN